MWSRLASGCRASGWCTFRRRRFISNFATSSTWPKTLRCRPDLLVSMPKARRWPKRVVREAVEGGLNAVIVRARAVIGPGDNSLLPRIIEHARRGKLRRIGRGDNRVDLTYVDNLVYALALATVRGAAGSVATVTNQEPVLLWPVVERVCQELELPLPRRPVSRGVALAVSRLSERWQTWRRPDREPPLTAYATGLLATSQTFSPAAAREAFGYRPLVPLDEGIRRTLSGLKERDDRHAGTHVEVTLLTTGYTPQHYGLAERGAAGKSRSFTPPAP